MSNAAPARQLVGFHAFPVVAALPHRRARTGHAICGRSLVAARPPKDWMAHFTLASLRRLDRGRLGKLSVVAEYRSRHSSLAVGGGYRGAGVVVGLGRSLGRSARWRRRLGLLFLASRRIQHRQSGTHCRLSRVPPHCHWNRSTRIPFQAPAGAARQIIESVSGPFVYSRSEWRLPQRQ